MPWANRLGGPGTGRAAKGSRGVATLVTSRPSGLKRGPGEHAGDEAVGQGHEQPLPAGHEGGQAEHHDARRPPAGPPPR